MIEVVQSGGEARFAGLRHADGAQLVVDVQADGSVEGSMSLAPRVGKEEARVQRVDAESTCQQALGGSFPP